MTRPAALLLPLVALALIAWRQAAAPPAPVNWERVLTIVSLVIGVGGAALARWAVRTLRIDTLRTGLKHPDVRRDLIDLIREAVEEPASVARQARTLCPAVRKELAQDINELRDGLSDLREATDALLALSPGNRRREDRGPPPGQPEQRHPQARERME